MTRSTRTSPLLAAISAAGLACAPGCARLAKELEPPVATTVLEEYPRHGDPDAVIFNDLPVRLFFFSQTPPEGTEILRPVRILFKAVGEGATCRDAGIGGLQKLQRVAVRGRANAVVNIRATWEGEPIGDATRFGCRHIDDEYLLVWEGALAKAPEPPAPTTPAATAEASPKDDAADDADGDEGDDSTAARLRELQRLYYEGLITREEFLERRKEILDGL